jgi:hypothetical protein
MTSPQPSNESLYEACVGLMVANKSTQDSWSKVASFVYANSHLTHEDMIERFKVVEAQVKADFKVTALPSAWRSAKTVALKAKKLSVPLMAPNSTTGDLYACGKSAVERSIRDQLTISASPITDLERVLSSLNEAKTQLAKDIHSRSITPVDAIHIRLLANDILAYVEHLKGAH